MIDRNQNILLFGMPRSGTTWIGKIFDSSLDTLYMHEPDSWEKLDDLPLFIENDSFNEGAELLRNFTSKFPEMTNAPVTSKLPIFKKNYQNLYIYNAYKFSVYYSTLTHKLSFLKNRDPSKRINNRDDTSYATVWKSIESLGRLPYISKVLDRTKSIHIVRNPAGYISSVLNGESKHNFQSATPSADDYNIFQMLLDTKQGNQLCLSISELKKMDPVERLAVRWRLYNEIAFDQCKDIDNYYLLKYEDLCRTPLEKTKELFDFCGLNIDEQTLNFVNQSVSSNKDAYYSVYKNPLQAAYKWRKNLDKKKIDQISSVLSGSEAFAWYKDDFTGSHK